MSRTPLDLAVEACANTMLLTLRNLRLGGPVNQLVEELEAVQAAVADALLQALEGGDQLYAAPTASIEITKEGP